MSDPFLGEIKMVGFDYPPRQWASCNGQLLPINQNAALYSLLGTRYGGNGTTTVGIPDMRGRAPVHVDRSSPYLQQGMMGGIEAVRLTTGQLPNHTHDFMGTEEIATKSNPGTKKERTLGTETNDSIYSLAANLTLMNTHTVTPTGGDGLHENIQPYMAINFVIALQGLYPPRD